MPSAGPLRQAVENWVRDKKNGGTIGEWWERVKARWNEYDELQKKFDPHHPLASSFNMNPGGLGQPLYALTGATMFIDYLKKAIDIQAQPFVQPDPSEKFAEILHDVFSNKNAKELAEVVGVVFTEPILSILEQYAGDDERDPKEFARAFHGLMAGLTMGPGVVDITLEAATAGAVKGVGRALQSVYWNLGLGFLGWQTLAPLLSSGLQPGLERYYKRLYRPTRFTASDLRDLYALGKISREQLKEGAAVEGWRDRDMDYWIQLAFRTLSENEIFNARDKGIFSDDQVQERLRGLGIDPADIPIKMQLNPKKEINDAHDFSVSTARNGYNQGFISRDELTDILRKLKYTDQEIDLIVILEDAKRSNDRKSLTVSQVKSAWTENVIKDAEAVHWLEQDGFGGDQIKILLDTWRAEIVPTFRKLNIGTITGAYVEAIYTRAQARAKLIEVGLRAEDADLQLDLTEARNPAAFGHPIAAPARLLQPGTLAGLLAAGLIDADQMYQRLIALHFPIEDAKLQVEAAQLRAVKTPTPLTQSAILSAYLVGVYARSQAEAALSSLDYTDADIKTILDTFELKNPAVFYPDSVQSVRLPSITALVAAYNKGLISEAEYYSKAQELNYRPEDVALYLAISQSNEVKSTASLTRADVLSAYDGGFYSWGRALSAIEAMGYSEEDTILLLRMRKDLIQNTDIWSQFVSGAITWQETVGQLINASYNDQDIVDAFGKLSAGELASLGITLQELAELLASLPGGQ